MTNQGIESSVNDFGSVSPINILLDDAGAGNVAETIVLKLKDVGVRVRSVTVYPQANVSSWGTLLGLELRDAVTVTVDSPGGGSTDLSQLVTVEHISMTVRPKQWVIELQCFPITAFEQSDFWILGTSDDLDTDTVLA